MTKSISITKTGTLAIHQLMANGSDFDLRFGLWIICGESFQTPPDSFYHTEWQSFQFYSLSHMYDGEGGFAVRGGETLEVTPGKAILMPPDVQHRYGGVNGKAYCEDSICFCGPIADHLRSCGIITPGVFEFGSHRRLRHLAELACAPSPAGRVRANMMLLNLLSELFLNRETSPAHSLIDRLLQTISSQPQRWWQLTDMAEFCNLSEAQVRRLFVRHTGMLPKAYIEKWKLKLAAGKLLTSNDSLASIAQSLGYQDQFHFNRRFKKFFGISPGQYRKQLR